MKSKARKILWYVAVCATVTIIAFFSWDQWTKQQLASAKERCRVAGMPTTLTEVRPPTVADQENAAPVLEQIGKKLAAARSQDVKGVVERITDFRYEHPAFRLSRAEADELAKLLESDSVKELLDLIHEAAKRPGHDAHIAYEKGLTGAFLNISPALDSMKLLAASACLAANRGEIERASEELSAMFAATEWFRREPTLIAMLTRLASLGITLDTLEKCLAIAPFPRPWLDRLSEHLPTIDLTPDVLRAFAGEHLIGIGAEYEKVLSGAAPPWETLSHLSDTPTEEYLIRACYSLRGFVRLEAADTLERFRLMRIEVANVAQGEPSQSKHIDQISEAIPSRFALERFVLPTLASSIRRVWRSRVNLQLAIAGIALETYRREGKNYPEQLDALVPRLLGAIPIDPYSGKALTYRRTAQGAEIYSIGPNRRDDGGVYDQEADRDDVAWHAGYIVLPHRAATNKN